MREYYARQEQTYAGVEMHLWALDVHRMDREGVFQVSGSQGLWLQNRFILLNIIGSPKNLLLDRLYLSVFTIFEI